MVNSDYWVNFSLCTKSPVLCRNRSFSLSHWERVGERACDLDQEFYPGGSFYVLLLKLMCLLTPTYKKPALPFVPSPPLNPLPLGGEGEHFCAKPSTSTYHL